VINFRGDLFATTFSFAMQALLRLGSSLILTRVLRPEAYGTITILVSILYVVGNLLDTNVTLFIVRDKEAEQPRYLNTAWTIRLIRSLLSCAALMVFAPLIATKIYDLPALTLPLRVYAMWFLVDGFETLSFPLAIRRKEARLQVYSELGAAVLGTGFSIVYCYFDRTFWGIVYGMLVTRLTMTLLSWRLYPELRPRPFFDRVAAREILGYSKFTIPSSLLTLSYSQFDKVIFLRFFDLRLLGIYSLAGNIVGAVESLITKISQAVLYPRCAHNWRENPDTAKVKFYTENVKLFGGILALPAAVAGAAHLIIAVLYDPRYSEAGSVLQAFAIRSVLLSLASPAEDLLISTGLFHIILVGNILRTIWIIIGSLAGYYFFGFLGFVYGLALSGLPPLLYYWWLQKSKGLLTVKYELYKVGFALTVGIATYLCCALFLTLFPGFRLRR
jgi:O-antigen/teichoic acid export membrane protein